MASRTRWIYKGEPRQPVDKDAPKVYYGTLNQIKLRPELRECTILKYDNQGVEGLFSEIQKMLGEDKRSVKCNPYFYTKYSKLTLKQRIIKFIKDPFGIEYRKGQNKLKEFLNNPRSFYDHIDYWN